MRILSIKLLLIVGSILWGSVSCTLAAESESYILEISTLSHGGEPVTSPNYAFSNIIIGGEVGGVMSSANYSFSTGYISCLFINTPPEMDTLGPQDVSEGQLLIFTVTAGDPENDDLTYSISATPKESTQRRASTNEDPVPTATYQSPVSSSK
jgi:hypothetical protein